MQEAIKMIPFKLPASAIAIMTIMLALVNLVGLLKVQMNQPPPYLILLVIAFLSIVSVIIWLKIKTINTQKRTLKSVKRVPQEQYDKDKNRQTIVRVDELKKGQEYKSLIDKGSNFFKVSSSNDASDSEQQSMIVSCHQVATRQKLF